jgi:uncharacterized protein YgiM (DUF1202 family)
MTLAHLWIRRSAIAAATLLLVAGDAHAAATQRDTARPQLAQTDDRADITFWESIKDSKNPAEYKAYLDTFPNGKFAALARARIAAASAPAPATAPAPSTSAPALPAAAPTAPAAPPPAAPAAAPVEVEPMNATYAAAANAVVRAQPSARSAQIGSVRAGSEVRVTGRTKAGDWYRVALQGKDGYVSASLLAAGPPAAPGGRAVAGRQYTTSKQAVVRQQPNADSPQTSTIPANQPVTVTSDIPGTDWYRVSYQGADVGYMHGSQLAGVVVAGGAAAPVAAGAPAPASPYAPPSLPGQQPAATAASTAPALTTGAAQSQAAQLPPATSQAQLKVEYWTAQTAGGQGNIRIYPQPSSSSPFIPGEYYVDEQAIKVLEVIPGRRQTPWLKVETPSGKIGYVFGGQARPPGTTRSGRRVFGPEVSD